MIEPIEVELKLEYEAGGEQALLDAPVLAGVARECETLASTYFDTPERALRAAGFTLRIRKAGKRHIQTVKAGGGTAAGLFVRSEWECDVPGDRPVIPMPGAPLVQTFPADVLERIAPLFVTRVARTSAEIIAGDSRIALALDQGEVIAGERRAPLHELELELQSGEPAGLFALARALDRAAPLRLGVRPKSERGYALADDLPPAPAKAPPVGFAGGENARDAFAAIASSALRHFRLNEPLLTASGAVEAIHQARVALRRLRSALSLFRPLLAGDERARDLGERTRTLASTLGAVRDIDVLIPRLPDTLLPRLREARTDALATARATLAAPETRALMIDWAEWLAIGRWRLEPGDPDLARTPARDFAADALDRQLGRLAKRGRHLARLEPAARHRARIAAKTLRYAVDFFTALFPGRKARRRAAKLLTALAALQDELGALNDMAIDGALLARFGIADTVAGGAGDTRRHLKRAARQFDRLMDIEPFWHGQERT